MTIDVFGAMERGVEAFFVAFGFTASCVALLMVCAILAALVGSFIKAGSGDNE